MDYLTPAEEKSLRNSQKGNPKKKKGEGGKGQEMRSKERKKGRIRGRRKKNETGKENPGSHILLYYYTFI